MFGKDINKNASYPPKPTLSFYLVIFILLICSRLFDMSTTYIATPNLTMESNIMVRILGLDWFRFIVLNILIIMILLLLFEFSWSRFSKRGSIRYKNEPNPKPRNIPLEIGITLPIYVIITGYFQGLINILIYMEWVLISFTHLLFLYPVIVGGIFGSISLFLTKKILYSSNPRKSKKAHKVMVAKETVKHIDPTEYPRPQENNRSEEEKAQSLYS